MNKLFSFFSIMLLSSILYAQDYRINFEGTGSSTTVTSVFVENLTQRKSVALTGDEVLHLAPTITAVNPDFYDSNQITIYPNPVADEGTIDFNVKSGGTVVIELFDLNGKKIFLKNSYAQAGINSFKISGLSKGVYFVKVNAGIYTYSGKIVCICEHRRQLNCLGLEFIGNSENRLPLRKNASTEKYLQFNKGDVLKITGKSANYTTIVGISPYSDKIMTFNFMPCVDGDGNNYPVVQVGEQIWMGENLRTTKLNDGTEIPNVTKDAEWGALTTPGYCWANNDTANKSPYGGLYNWYAVNSGKLAPKGWHVPTDKEWDDFVRNFGGSIEMVYKIQITGNEYRKPDAFNTALATNETGFSMVPGGMRSGANNAGAGQFSGYKEWGFYWSSTFDGTFSQGDAAHSRFIIDSFLNLGMLLRDGLSIRCLKD